MTTPTIRVATAEDKSAIFSLARQFATSFVVDADAFAQAFAALVTAPDACLLVAETNAETVGYLLGFDHYAFYANGRVAWVEEIMVSERYRRQGIGQAMMAEFERWAATRGARLVALATRRAAAFYLATGYEESAVYFRKLV